VSFCSNPHFLLKSTLYARNPGKSLWLRTSRDVQKGENVAKREQNPCRNRAETAQNPSKSRRVQESSLSSVRRHSHPGTTTIGWAEGERTMRNTARTYGNYRGVTLSLSDRYTFPHGKSGRFCAELLISLLLRAQGGLFAQSSPS